MIRNFPSLIQFSLLFGFRIIDYKLLIARLIRLHDSIVVSIPACHAGDRGSIPRRGAFFLFAWIIPEMHKHIRRKFWKIKSETFRINQNTYVKQTWVLNTNQTFNRSRLFLLHQWPSQIIKIKNYNDRFQIIRYQFYFNSGSF